MSGENQWGEVERREKGLIDFSRYPGQMVLKDGRVVKVFIEIQATDRLGHGRIEIPLGFDPTYEGIGEVKGFSQKQKMAGLAEYNRQQLGVSKDTNIKDLMEKELGIPWTSNLNGVSSSSSGGAGRWQAEILAELSPTDEQNQEYSGILNSLIPNRVKMQILAQLLEEKTGLKLEPVETAPISAPTL